MTTKMVPEVGSDPTTQDSDSKFELSSSPKTHLKRVGSNPKRKKSKVRMIRAFPLTKTVNSDLKVDYGQKISSNLSPKQLFEILMSDKSKLPGAICH